MGSVVADIAGAQAQVLTAAQTSIWARCSIAAIEDLDAALWKKRNLARAWCMRRTMFLLPSSELAIFARGTARRSEYNLRWALEHVASRQQLERLLDNVLGVLDRPRSRTDISRLLKAQGYKLKLKAGGGWGDSRTVPWVEVGSASLSVGFLLHVIAAQNVICSGPNVGNESTFVRADKWLPQWKDIPQESAEEELLSRYLKAFGPTTLTDFALWMGLYVRDARVLWSRLAEKMTRVDVEGWEAHVLWSDLPELERAAIDVPVVRLLPNFDTFLLGHKSHGSIVDAGNMRKVYRAQGWVSPVVLVNGRAEGVWSYERGKNDLEVRAVSFSRFSDRVKSMIREEASMLGGFLGIPNVRTVVS